MTRAIAMCGHEKSLRHLRNTFYEMGVDLVNKDYQSAEDITEALKTNPDLSAILIVELAALDVNGGKHKLIQDIRAVDETVRIIFCGSSGKRDVEFEKWCQTYSVSDFVYPKRSGSYDASHMVRCISKGRNPPNPINDRRMFDQPRDIQRPAVPPDIVNAAEPDAFVQVIDETRQKPAVSVVKSMEYVDKTPADEPKELETVPEPEITPFKEAVINIPEPLPFIVKRTTDKAFSVAVFNLSCGAGASTMAYRLSEALCNAGEKTALIPADGKLDIGKVQCSAELLVPFHPDEAVHMIRRMSERKHGFLIIDFGALFSKSSKKNDRFLQTFIRCDFHIGMAFTGPWHDAKFSEFINNGTLAEQIRQGNCIFIFDNDIHHRPEPGLSLFTRTQAPPEFLANELLKQTEDAV